NPQRLTALCGPEIGPGQLDCHERPIGMPCVACLRNAPPPRLRDGEEANACASQKTTSSGGLLRSNGGWRTWLGSSTRSPTRSLSCVTAQPPTTRKHNRNGPSRVIVTAPAGGVTGVTSAVSAARNNWAPVTAGVTGAQCL